MNWKLAHNRTRRATIAAQAYDTKRQVRLLGYEAAARIAEANEALKEGTRVLALHGGARDGKVVNDADWKGLK